MKDKNMILLIGIILIWLFIIRPNTKNSSGTESKGTETAMNEGAEKVQETAQTPVSGYVTQSIANNSKTISGVEAVDEYPTRTYTA